MGNQLVWGPLKEEDCCLRREELLQPRFSQVGIRCLAGIRLFITAFFIVHNALVCIVTYDTFWMFLTNMTHLAITLNYLLLTIAHIQRGHLKKQTVD